MAADAGSLPTRPLGRSALDLTTLGFGGGPIGWLDGPDAEARAAGALAAAWDAGIRYFTQPQRFREALDGAWPALVVAPDQHLLRYFGID